MPVRGLTVIATRPDALRPALELAAANAALGGRARVFAQGEAVTGLVHPLADGQDAMHAACGLPTLAGLFDEALALGVEPIACQSGLQLAGLTADRLDPRMGYGGPVSLLQTLGEDRLLSI